MGFLIRPFSEEMPWRGDRSPDYLEKSSN